MEPLNLIPDGSLGKGQQKFLIQSEQDGLFFGSEFLQHILKSKASDSIVTSYLQDGDCVFKGQIGLSFNLKTGAFKREDLLSVVSYLSGAYTLLHCFAEKNFDFFIMAAPTPKFDFSEWEEKIIIKAGCHIQKCSKNICWRPEHITQALKKGNQQITLSNLKMSKAEIKKTLVSLPPSVTTNLHGNFLPSDLEEFTAFNINAVWPLCLQGFFPCLKMKILEESNGHRLSFK